MKNAIEAAEDAIDDCLNQLFKRSSARPSLVWIEKINQENRRALKDNFIVKGLMNDNKKR